MHEDYNYKDIKKTRDPVKGSKLNKKAYKHALNMVESSGGKFLDNDASSAAGKYHFLYEIIKNDPILEGISKREFINRPELHEKIMDKALDGELTGYAYGEKYANKLINEFGLDKSTKDVTALVHFLGSGDARKYLKDPEKFSVPGKTNATVNQYLERFNRQYDQYLLDNPDPKNIPQPEPQPTYPTPPNFRNEQDLIQPKDNIAFSQRSLADMIPQQQEVSTQDNEFKKGGQMQSTPGEANNMVTRFENGGLHEHNPLGGIPVGVGPNGKPNLVEEGETKWNDYIFSNVYDMDGNYSGGEGKKENMFEDGGILNEPTDPPKGKRPIDPDNSQRMDNTNIGTKNVLDPKGFKFNDSLQSLTSILDESDATARKKSRTMSEHEYYNPKVEKGITTGDAKQDFLYNNQYLMDIPLVGRYIKDKIKEKASKSGGRQQMTKDDIENADSAEEYMNYGGSSGSPNANSPRLLDQYFSEEPLLELATNSPKSDYYPFLKTYSARGKDWEKNIDIKGENDWDKSPRTRLNEQIQEVLRGQYVKNNGESDIGPEEEAKLMFNQFLKDKKTIYSRHDDNSHAALAMNADLGGHSVGIGYDEESGYPYMSVSDAWDFEPRGYTKKWGADTSGGADEEARQLSKIQSSLMHKAGHPYKLYDRFYINPKTGKYMSSAEMKKLISDNKNK